MSEKDKFNNNYLQHGYQPQNGDKGTNGGNGISINEGYTPTGSLQTPPPPPPKGGSGQQDK